MGNVMVTTMQKWGTSLGVRIPKTILTNLGIKENDKVEIQNKGNGILIKKALTDLDMLFEGYEDSARCSEFNFGEDVGDEKIW